MNENPVPEYAVIGHPNEGKSAVVSTLAEDDSVKVSPTPGETRKCRTFPVKIDGKEVIRFTDTPGFQCPRRTLKWMETYEGEAREMIGTFISAHKDNADFANECELFMPVKRGAGIIFVVDGSRPIRSNDRMEMEILRLTGCPRMAIINCKEDDEGFLDDWKDAFRRSFNSIRVFNAHNADHRERIALLESLKSIDQDWQLALEKVIVAFKGDWERRSQRIAEIICDLLETCLTYSVARTYSSEAEGKAAVPELQVVYKEGISGIERKAHDRIRKLYKHHIFQVDLPPQSIIGESLFASRTWQVLGLTQGQLAGIAALSGGLIGAGLDIAAHGLTFGLFTAVGSAIGIGSAYVFGENMARAQIIGLKLGGYRVDIGPNENMNFPYILMDRALLYYGLILNWAHGRRDYPEDPRSLIPLKDDRQGFTSSWSMGEKRACQSFFKAIQKGEETRKDQSRGQMMPLLLRTMQNMSSSEVSRSIQ